jgi:HK97 gp10 family phage protein
MTRRTVTIRGVPSLRRVLRQAPAEMSAELKTAVALSLTEVEIEMLSRVPRRTGELASVIKTRTQRDGLSGRVGPGAGGRRDQRKAGWRAKFQEFGTQQHAAQPFVFPSLAAKREGIRTRLAAAVGRVLLRIAGKSREES